MSMTDTWHIHAYVELPTRHPALVEAVMGAAGAAQRPIGDVQVEAVTGARTALTPQLLDAAVWDRQNTALLLRGPDIELRVPLVPGELRGHLSAHGHVPKAVVELVATLMDGCQCEWGLVGPRSSTLEIAAPAELTAAFPLPAVDRITYLSPDLSHQADLVQLVDTPGVRRLRSFVGGLLLVAEPGAEERLYAPLQGALTAGPRPPVDAYPLPGDHLMLMRDVSPGLQQWQEHIVGAALEHARGRGLAGVPVTLEGLTLLDRCLVSVAASLPPPVVEGWSAFAGAVAVQAGGRWRRILDPWTPFPANMVVVLPGNRAFQPHQVLVQQARAGALTGLAGVLAQILDLPG
jgi:hypothetical protein